MHFGVLSLQPLSVIGAPVALDCVCATQAPPIVYNPIISFIVNRVVVVEEMRLAVLTGSGDRGTVVGVLRVALVCQAPRGKDV